MMQCRTVAVILTGHICRNIYFDTNEERPEAKTISKRLPIVGTGPLNSASGLMCRHESIAMLKTDNVILIVCLLQYNPNAGKVNRRILGPRKPVLSESVRTLDCTS